VKSPICLVCTGLGRVNRGFEQYIAGLSAKLSDIGLGVWVASGGAWQYPENVKTLILNTPHRGSWWLRGSQNAFIREQQWFALALLPKLLLLKPAIVYLGEYRLYCYLYKLRKIFRLSYSLCLYTGGQAVPGKKLFDPDRDFIHHVTDVYLEDCKHFPATRQVLLPHFLEEAFDYDNTALEYLHQKAGDKKIILSVGTIDKSTKRMHLLLMALAPHKEKVFPVLLGEASADSPKINQLAESLFGAGNYIISKAPHAQLGSWYQAADGFVLCSPKESFGLALIEALYHGLPVACYRFPETEFVLQDHAYWLHGEDPEELGGELKAWIEKMPAYPMSNLNANRFIRENYTWQGLGASYFDMFKGMVG
jgi:glycosyltransferase involved in cell wall biosynthesis